MRMCVDYRKLTDLTRKDRTTLPRIDELLDSLYGAHYFNTLDLYKGYHQVRIKEREKHKRAFRTHYGLFEYYSMLLVSIHPCLSGHPQSRWAR
jgi:hypothetical protein